MKLYVTTLYNETMNLTTSSVYFVVSSIYLTMYQLTTTSKTNLPLFEQKLRSALDSMGFSNTRIVAPESQLWYYILKDLKKNKQLASAIDIFG